MNILEEIAQKRRIDVALRKERVSFEEIKEQAERIAEAERKKWAEQITGAEQKKQVRECYSGYAFPFRQSISREGINFICEVKKASPSKGVIAKDFPYVEIAKEYEKAGAAAISVLTEPQYFLGKDEYLSKIAENVSIPVLRKDFTVDAYQIYEAKVLGASAVLLICSLLNDKELKAFLDVAHSIGLSALVEVHNEEEVRRALEVGADIVGVNNRDLRDFTVDINNSLRLRKLVPEGVIFVSESGIKTAEDIGELKAGGVNAVLIGETFMRSDNKEQLLKALAQ